MSGIDRLINLGNGWIDVHLLSRIQHKSLEIQIFLLPHIFHDFVEQRKPEFYIHVRSTRVYISTYIRLLGD